LFSYTISLQTLGATTIACGTNLSKGIIWNCPYIYGPTLPLITMIFERWHWMSLEVVILINALVKIVVFQPEKTWPKAVVAQSIECSVTEKKSKVSNPATSYREY
jgi:hypothetical protein